MYVANVALAFSAKFSNDSFFDKPIYGRAELVSFVLGMVSGYET